MSKVNGTTTGSPPKVSGAATFTANWSSGLSVFHWAKSTTGSSGSP